jgi:hypothetical protein
MHISAVYWMLINIDNVEQYNVSKLPVLHKENIYLAELSHFEGTSK